MATWSRTFFAGMGWTTTGGHEILASVPAGQTLRRVRWSWGFAGLTNTAVDMVNGQSLIMIGGLVTTIGNGSETVPLAITNRNDETSEAQRWLWWEARVPAITAVDSAHDVIVWESRAPQEQVDTAVQVHAPGTIPVGQTLNLSFSFQADTAWDSSGECRLWVASSVLY